MIFTHTFECFLLNTEASVYSRFGVIVDATFYSIFWGLSTRLFLQCNTMGQERLNGLALMYVHRDKNVDIEQVINLFAQMHPRRIRMANILHDDGV